MIQTSNQILADQIERIVGETDFCGVIAVYQEDAPLYEAICH